MKLCMINQNPRADLLPEFDSMQYVFCSALNAARLVPATTRELSCPASDDQAVDATCNHHACLRLRVHEQAEILLQCTCEQVVIAWGQQTGSFLYQNNHEVTILFPCIQSSETVCPKSCTEYPTDVIPPSYVLL